jgi:hypothetical protein
VRALVSLRTVLGNAGADLLETTLSVSEVHKRFVGDQPDAQLADELATLAAGLPRPLLAA